MQFFPSRTVFLQIGSIHIQWYAVLIMTGALIVYYLSSKEIVKKGYDSEVMDDLFIYIMLSGIVGARIWYVLFSDLQAYLNNPITIFQVWNGGLAIQGGIFGAALCAFYYCQKHHYSFMQIADVILPKVLIAQAIGRWGNFVNQEAYGGIVDESYFNGILSFLKDDMYIAGAYREPMFFIESVGCTIGFILIYLYLKKSPKIKRGYGAYCYLTWYGLIRFWIEIKRSDSLMIGNLKMAMIISVIFMLIGLAGLSGVFDKKLYAKKPVLMFDLDGTLLDTEKAIFKSFEHVLKAHVEGIVLTEEDYVGFLGPTLAQSFEKYAPGCDTEQLIQEYRTINYELQKQYVAPIKGVEKLLAYCKENGYDMVIGSSKRTDTIMYGLSLVGLDSYFPEDHIIGVEKVTNPKPHKETIVKCYNIVGGSCGNAIYVGDSTSDIACAKNAGVYAIAMISNELKREQLSNCGANAVIDDMSEIISILQGKHIYSYDER